MNESSAGGKTLFRAEAVAHRARPPRDGDILRIDLRWSRLAYLLVIIGALVATVFVIVVPVSEYATGPAVAWFPLAPGDIYWPGYTKDLDLIRRINQGAVAEFPTIGPGIDGANGPIAGLEEHAGLLGVLHNPIVARNRGAALGHLH